MKADRRWWNDGALRAAYDAERLEGLDAAARDQLVAGAQRLVDIAEGGGRTGWCEFIGHCPAESAILPKGDRVVVVVTDELGKFVGVAANTPDADVRAILAAALAGAERREHARQGSAL